MKHRIKIIYSIITIGILLSGFLLPRWILRIQDQRQTARVDRYELNSITLNVTNQLFEKLSAVKSGVFVKSRSQMDARMSEEEVYQQMVAANQIFGVCAIDMDTIQEEDFIQGLVIDEEKGISFIIWHGHLEDYYCAIDMFIDDATGKMLGITTVIFEHSDVDDRFTGYNLEELQEQLKTYYELADVLPGENGYVDVDGLADVYGLTPEEIERVIVETNGNVSVIGDLNRRIKLNFRLVNEMGEDYDLELYIGDEVYSVN